MAVIQWPDLDGLIREILRAVEPGRPVRMHAELLSSLGPCRVLAIGKAAHSMAEAAAPLIGDDLRAGIIIAPPLKGPCPRPAPGVAVHTADHPLPTARNLAAASAAVDLVRAIQPDESLLVLLSGGGSALLTLPVPGLELDDLRAITSGLLRAGATIDDLNCVRKHCEQLKGGGLVRLAVESGCRRVVSLILSDVVGDRLDVIGSGPTAPDPTTYADALAILERFNLRDVAPAITRHLRGGATGTHHETLKPGDPTLSRVENTIIGSNAFAVGTAVAELHRMGFEIAESCSGITGEARDVGSRLARRTRELARLPSAEQPPRRAIVWGGETTVTVRGTGTGGRNQELALAAAIALDGVPNCMVISLATDGVDGNSTAAGAVVTGETAAAARAAGLDPAAGLATNDSNGLFSTLDAAQEKGRRILIQTGPTGTNVNDVMIGLTCPDLA